MTQERLEEVLRDLDAPELADERLRAACRATIPVPATSQRVRWEWNPFAHKGVKTLMLPRTLALGAAAAVAAVAAFSYGWQKRAAKVASAPTQFATNQDFNIDSPYPLAGMRDVSAFRLHMGGLMAGAGYKSGVPIDRLITEVAKADQFPDGGIDVYFDRRYGRRQEMYLYKTPRVNGTRVARTSDQVATSSDLHLADATRIGRSRTRNGYHISTRRDATPPKGDALNADVPTLREFVRSAAGGGEASLVSSRRIETPVSVGGELMHYEFRGKTLPELKGVNFGGRILPDVAPYLSVEIVMNVTARRIVQKHTCLIWEENGREKYRAYLLTARYSFEPVPRSVFNPEDFKKGILRYDPESEVQTEKVEFKPGVLQKAQEYRIVLSDADGTRVIYRQTLKPGEAMKPQSVRAKGSECRIQILNASGQNVYDHKWTDNRLIRDPVK